MTFLSEKISFPPTSFASPEGIVAIGGDLSIPRLLLAYQKGIFPWYNEGSEILWWSPDPRFVLFTDELKISKSMKQIMRSGRFRITFDTCFKEVIQNCKSLKRSGQQGTWITQEMEESYIAFHKKGHAHSVEVWENDELVGGLYGVSIGRVFYGESMFAKVSNASKFGFIKLVQSLTKKGYKMIDCQDYTAHLESLGAREIPRLEFEKIIAHEQSFEGVEGNWNSLI